jgi:lactoylglutathione lyase
VEGVDYVILYVRDLERSVAFYRDGIGLPFRFHDGGYAEFVTRGTKFGLYERSRCPS